MRRGRGIRLEDAHFVATLVDPDPDVMNLDGTGNAVTSVGNSQRGSYIPACHGAMAEEGREDTFPRNQDSKLKIVSKRKHFAAVLHKVLVDARDGATL